MRGGCVRPRLLNLAAVTNTVGAPFFAHVAKGGYRECIRTGLVAKDKNGVGSIAARPCKKRKDGAPSE